ncbi:MAG: response regulator [Candidatus Staskawiczbacteria bacterium]|nr:response regulator [Candidatus Staskawiczbacteria bacterium]
MAKKILIVEDDIFLRQLISKKMSSEGFDVSLAVDGADGVKEAKKIMPDLILLDLVLPTMDGFEVLSKIKADSETGSIPVIILSNLGQQEEISKGLKLGAADFLVKAQLTPEEIVEKVKTLLK